MHAQPRPHRQWVAATVVVAVLIGLSAAVMSRTSRSEASEPPAQPSPTSPSTTVAEPTTPLRGAMAGLSLDALADETLRRQVITAANAELGRAPSPRQPFEAESVDDPFVDDALAAYTLALGGHATGEDRYFEAAARIVDAWVSTMTSTQGACPHSGACQTSLVLSRAAPALVHAADLLESAGRQSDAERVRLRRWVRDVALPAASERDNNWGDAGTYLRAVAAVELGDAELDVKLYRRSGHRFMPRRPPESPIHGTSS